MRSVIFALFALAISSASAFSSAPASRATASRVSTVTMAPIQNFGGKKYGVDVFLPSGNVNPAYLAAERKEKAEAKKKNFAKFQAIKAKQMAKKTYDIADVIKQRIGNIYPEGYFPGKGGK